MESALTALQQRFSSPSNNENQGLDSCSICWTDYDQADRPIKLPCGHIFGEECILAWAQGTTPSGRYNGCPICRAELLPPSWSSRTAGLNYWMSAIWQSLWIEFGGNFGILVRLVSCIVVLVLGTFADSPVKSCLRRVSSSLLWLFLAD